MGPGANALLAPEVEAKLKLSPEQRQQIQAIVRVTAKKFNGTHAAKVGSPGLKAELDRIRLLPRITQNSPMNEENAMNRRAMYHDGSRQMQDHFDSRRLADR